MVGGTSNLEDRTYISQTKPTLEGLPTELLILILLEIPDQSDLKSIVLSSPDVHQAYLTARPEILGSMVTALFGPLLGEGILAIRSRGLVFADREEDAIALLDTWRRKDEIKQAASTSLKRIDVVDNVQESLALFRFHSQLEFFLADYATNAPRPEWITETDWASCFIPMSFSHTEKYRFLRAMCRLQTLANIFGTPETTPKPGLRKQNTNNWVKYGYGDYHARCNRMREVYRLFFGTMPPWEYSEMGCIWSYLLPKFRPFYDDILESLREFLKNTPSTEPCINDDFHFIAHDALPPISPYISTVSNLESWVREDGGGTESLLEIGPDFLYRVLHTTFLPRRDMILTNIQEWSEALIGDRVRDIIEPSEEAIVPLIEPADKHSNENYEELWSSLPSTETPNKAWKKSHILPEFPGQTFEGAIFDMGYMKGWKWGFAIWDDERLEVWKAPVLFQE